MRNRFLKAAAAATFILASGPASALTFVLDFGGGTDIFGAETSAFESTPFEGFGLTDAQIRTSVLDRVSDHFLNYPTSASDPSSTLPIGMQLDINFELGSIGSAPSNMDSEYFFMAVGTAVPANPGLFGQACLACVRNAAGTGPNFGVTVGNVVGSIFTDAIAGIANLAASNAQLINLIAGTTSHEIAHTLSLVHAGAQSVNPGDSAWGLMGSGATSMPNGQRVLDREFTYSNFDQLIDSVGLRDTPVSAVPLPAMGWMFLLSLGALGALGRRSSKRTHA